MRSVETIHLSADGSRPIGDQNVFFVPEGAVGHRPKMGFFRVFGPSKQHAHPLKTRVRAF